ncbi:hypothetical protein ScPMuIL_017962 [Solemya velum]
MRLRVCAWCLVVLTLFSSVKSYPQRYKVIYEAVEPGVWKELPLGDTFDSNLQPYEYSDNYGNFNDDSLITKRGPLSLNELLARLVAMNGGRDIPFTGKSSYLRFGAGKR